MRIQPRPPIRFDKDTDSLVIGDTGFNIADISPSTADIHEARAIARLLGASGNLLDALEYLREMAEHTARGIHNCPEIWGALRQADKAISDAS